MGTENKPLDTNPQTNTVLSGLCEKFHRSFKYDENIVTSLSSPVKMSRVKKIDPAVLNKNKQRSSSVDDPFFFH